MKKVTNKDYVYIGALTGALALLIVIFTREGQYLFGSTTDWECQHITLPEYFRNLFYDSGELFPSLALNLGAGQNIFYFAYYGLFSPYIILSYLMPWVGMTTFITASAVFCVWVTVIMFYVYRRRNGDREENALLLSALFLFSAPLIFHAHRHVMFILYLPFLIGAYFGVERYLKSKRFGLLIISSVLLIFTSYYYAPTSLISIFILAVYRYLHIHKNDKFSFKAVFRFSLKICGFLLLAVAISAVLLLPTAYIILHSRGAGSSGDAINIKYFLPEVKVSNLLYSPYSLGLSSIALFAVIVNFFSKRRELIFLSSFFSLVFFFPAVNYLTNGMLYFNGKTFIPLIPLCLVMIGGFLRTFFRNFKIKKNAFFVFILMLISAVISFMILDKKYLSLMSIFAADIILTSVFLVLTSVFKKRRFLISFLIAFSMLICCATNIEFEGYVSREDYDRYTSEDIEKLENIAAEKCNGIERTSDYFYDLYHVNHISSTSLYKTTMYSSTFNKGYNELYYDVLNGEVSHRNSSITNPTRNIFSNVVLSDRFVIAKDFTSAGYKEVARSGDYALFENEDVLPFAYMSNRVISEKAYSKLEYPYTAEALTKYIVTSDGDGECELSTVPGALAMVSSDLPDTLTYKGTLKTGLTVTAERKSTAVIGIDNNKYKIVILRLKLDPAQKEWKGDRSITVNGVQNKITEAGATYHNKNFVFDYVLSSDKPINTLEMKFTQGVYKITGAELYYLNYSDISSAASEVNPLIIDSEKTAGDRIYGTINAERDGKLLFTLPYDEGYTFRVDGEIVDYEKANVSFMAIDIPAGEHTVTVDFRAPWLNAGMIISGVSVFAFAALMILSAIRRKKKSSKDDKTSVSPDDNNEPRPENDSLSRV